MLKIPLKPVIEAVATRVLRGQSDRDGGEAENKKGA